MSTPNTERSMTDILNEYLSHNKMFHFEGDTGVERLETLAKDLGYPGHDFRFGSPLEHFLSDNPGAQEAILNWIHEQEIQEWKDNLISELPEMEDDSEEDVT